MVHRVARQDIRADCTQGSRPLTMRDHPRKQDYWINRQVSQQLAHRLDDPFLLQWSRAAVLSIAFLHEVKNCFTPFGWSKSKSPHLAPVERSVVKLTR
jgi:hypothetical protein